MGGRYEKFADYGLVIWPGPVERNQPGFRGHRPAPLPYQSNRTMATCQISEDQLRSAKESELVLVKGCEKIRFYKGKKCFEAAEKNSPKLGYIRDLELQWTVTGNVARVAKKYCYRTVKSISWLIDWLSFLQWRQFQAEIRWMVSKTVENTSIP